VTSRTTTPSPPTPHRLDPADPHTRLQRHVRNALLTLPGEFEFANPISGINATDLFNLNTLLGAAIETEVVRTLNTLREIWDPDNEWPGYRFVRSSQAFPDVRLVRPDEPEPAIGVELKGWWLLSKEGVPSLRYQVAPAACAPHDLVCVVPWYLSNAVSGVAAVTEPWIESARYAAEYRDHWWRHVRSSKGRTGIQYPGDARPYPVKADKVLAQPEQDGGGNFGRLSRAKGLMDDFLVQTMALPILGIPVADWVAFLKLHSDTATRDDIKDALEAAVTDRVHGVANEAAERIVGLLEQMADLLRA